MKTASCSLFLILSLVVAGAPCIFANTDDGRHVGRLPAGRTAGIGSNGQYRSGDRPGGLRQYIRRIG
jgi:hypothetical protein